MPRSSQPGLRADAAQNVRRIVTAAQKMLNQDLNIGLDEIADEAGVGIATLYRRFPTREALIRAVLAQLFADEIEPTVKKGLSEPDPVKALVLVLEKVLKTTSEKGPRFALPYTRTFPPDMAAWVIDPISEILERGRQAGVFRSDLDPERDSPRIFFMLINVVPTFAPGSEGWRRYLNLVVDALTCEAGSGLYPSEPFEDSFLS